MFDETMNTTKLFWRKKDKQPAKRQTLRTNNVDILALI